VGVGGEPASSGALDAGGAEDQQEQREWCGEKGESRGFGVGADGCGDVGFEGDDEDGEESESESEGEEDVLGVGAVEYAVVEDEPGAGAGPDGPEEIEACHLGGAVGGVAARLQEAGGGHGDAEPQAVEHDGEIRCAA